MRRHRILASASLLRTDRRGVALIEFAFAVPILMLLFVGGYQLMDAVSAYRKVTATVRALADLTTQSSTMTISGAQQIIAASQQVMAPYSNSGSVMRITQIKIDQYGNPTVDWSQALAPGTGYTKGSAFSGVPSNLIQANTYLIYSEMSYQYVPHIASGVIGQIPLKDKIYMFPRSTASIPCSDCM